MKTTTETTCHLCNYVALSPGGLKGHMFRKHTSRGRKISKQASARMSAARWGNNGTGKHVFKERVYKRVARPAPSASIKFCPKCGCNLEAVNMAIEFSERN